MSEHAETAPGGSSDRLERRSDGAAPAAMERFLRGLPKAELHVHLEGTLEAELAVELAARHGIDLPFASVAALRAAYDFTDLQSFLDLYYATSAVLRTGADLRALTTAYLTRAAADGVRRAEVFVDPQTHRDHGLSVASVIEAVTAALDDGGTQLGVSTGLIVCFLRDRPVDEAMAVLEEALPFADRLLGVGLDSAEAGNPPDRFADVFARARDAGLRTVAHAGEEGPPEYVRQAIDVLGVERIDHGVRAHDDPDLLARVAARRLPLTVCPLSNVRLGVVDRLEDHNLPALIDAGVVVTINSDDPAYFGGYIGDVYVQTQRALGLPQATMTQLARSSLEAAFVGDAERRALLAELEHYVAAHADASAPTARAPRRS